MTTHQDSCGPTQTPDDVDIAALREKYRLEREKRLRKEGSKQYIELEDDFAGYYEVDPYTPAAPSRFRRTSTSRSSVAASVDCCRQRT